MKLFYRVLIADYDGDVEDLVSRSPYRLVHVPFGDPRVKKYTAIKKELTGPYIILVSKREVRDRDYDIMMSVFGPDAPRAEELMAEIEGSFGIETRDISDEAKRDIEMVESALRGMFGMR